MAFLTSFLAMHFVAKRYILQKKVSEGTNRNMPVRNTLVQLLAVYTNPERYNAQRHRQTDRQTDGRTDNGMMPIADHTCSSTIG